MTWPFRVLEMSTYQTLVVAEPGCLTIAALFAVAGVIWCGLGLVEAVWTVLDRRTIHHASWRDAVVADLIADDMATAGDRS